MILFYTKKNQDIKVTAIITIVYYMTIFLPMQNGEKQSELDKVKYDK